MTLRKVFEEKLKDLNMRIMQMGQEAEKMIDQTIQSIIHSDHELAKKTIKQDDIIDNMQLEIEKECALLIALEQPVASDLRFIISTIKIITDIERIADQCSDICKYIIYLNETTWNRDINYQRHIENMALTTKAMLDKTLTSYVTKDIEAIKEVRGEDDIIDASFLKIGKEITNEMMKNQEFISNGVYYLMIIKYLERIADHITNIAEWILYSTTGEYVIHED